MRNLTSRHFFCLRGCNGAPAWICISYVTRLWPLARSWLWLTYETRSWLNDSHMWLVHGCDGTPALICNSCETRSWMWRAYVTCSWLRQSALANLRIICNSFVAGDSFVTQKCIRQWLGNIWALGCVCVIVYVCVCCMCVTPKPSQKLPPSAGSCTHVYVHVCMCVCMRLCVRVCHTWNYAVLPILFRILDLCGRMIVCVSQTHRFTNMSSFIGRLHVCAFISNTFECACIYVRVCVRAHASASVCHT